KPTGLAINTAPGSKKLLIFLLGGGACYDAKTCATSCDPKVNGLCAQNLDGYEKGLVHEQLTSLPRGTIFDRRGESNPFTAYNWVFVPYCTGDFHTGAKVATYGTLHFGAKNLDVFLARLAPTFSDTERVVLAGASAGGFGAVFNYERVKKAFGNVRVDLIDDSGPPMSANDMPLQSTLFAAWGAKEAIPPDCDDCKDGWDRFIPFLAKKYPEARFSLLSSLRDPSIGPAFAGPIATPDGFTKALLAFDDAVLEPLPNARAFLVDD